jgi:hypothetical protein
VSVRYFLIDLFQGLECLRRLAAGKSLLFRGKAEGGFDGPVGASHLFSYKAPLFEIAENVLGHMFMDGNQAIGQTLLLKTGKCKHSQSPSSENDGFSVPPIYQLPVNQGPDQLGIRPKRRELA